MQTKIKISNWYCTIVGKLGRGKFSEFGISSGICQTKVVYVHSPTMLPISFIAFYLYQSSCYTVLDMARQIKSKIDAVEAFTVETVECYCLVMNQKNIT